MPYYTIEHESNLRTSRIVPLRKLQSLPNKIHRHAGLIAGGRRLEHRSGSSKELLYLILCLPGGRTHVTWTISGRPSSSQLNTRIPQGALNREGVHRTASGVLCHPAQRQLSPTSHSPGRSRGLPRWTPGTTGVDTQVHTGAHTCGSSCIENEWRLRIPW